MSLHSSNDGRTFPDSPIHKEVSSSGSDEPSRLRRLMQQTGAHLARFAPPAAFLDNLGPVSYRGQQYSTGAFCSTKRWPPSASILQRRHRSATLVSYCRACGACRVEGGAGCKLVAAGTVPVDPEWVFHVSEVASAVSCMSRMSSRLQLRAHAGCRLQASRRQPVADCWGAGLGPGMPRVVSQPTGAQTS